MNYDILPKINKENDIRTLADTSQVEQLATEIRHFLIDSVSKTGGHIGANLGTIELTCALHFCFDLDKDKIVFDTGHIGYTHKILTGRISEFSSLNQSGGMSRFLDRAESPYDVIDASHAGTAISIASGLCLDNQDGYTVAWVGDGALVEGMSLEALNYVPERNLKLIIVVNDNGMAIPKNVGGISKLFEGSNWREKSQAFFEGMGYQYLSVADGHNVTELIDQTTKAKGLVENGPVILHVKTEKGKGLNIAKDHPYKLHFSMPFNPETGEGTSAVPAGKTYAVVAGETLYKLMDEKKDIYVITPSTPYASGLEKCLADFPDKTLDVGMAEQHALGMACGVSLAGKNVFMCFQSTFMQRALDQIIHDVCYMNLPVTILAVRSGFAGLDNATHHGIYDLSYLRGIPNLQIFYPGNSSDLEQMIQLRAEKPEKPMLILHPYEKLRENDQEFVSSPQELGTPQTLFEGKDGSFLCVGNTLEAAFKAREMLLDQEKDFGITNIRWIKPLPTKELDEFFEKNQRIITMEENSFVGGFGSAILEYKNTHMKASEVLVNAIDDQFVPQGHKEDLEVSTKIDPTSVVHKILSRWY